MSETIFLNDELYVFREVSTHLIMFTRITSSAIRAHMNPYGRDLYYPLATQALVLATLGMHDVRSKLEGSKWTELSLSTDSKIVAPDNESRYAKAGELISPLIRYRRDLSRSRFLIGNKSDAYYDADIRRGLRAIIDTLGLAIRLLAQQAIEEYPSDAESIQSECKTAGLEIADFTFPVQNSWETDLQIGIRKAAARGEALPPKGVKIPGESDPSYLWREVTFDGKRLAYVHVTSNQRSLSFDEVPWGKSLIREFKESGYYAAKIFGGLLHWLTEDQVRLSWASERLEWTLLQADNPAAFNVTPDPVSVPQATEIVDGLDHFDVELTDKVRELRDAALDRGEIFSFPEMVSPASKELQEKYGVTLPDPGVSVIAGLPTEPPTSEGNSASGPGSEKLTLDQCLALLRWFGDNRMAFTIASQEEIFSKVFQRLVNAI